MEPCPLCKKETCACDATQNDHAVVTIDAQKLKDQMAELSYDLIVINVLNEEYYKDCRIENSINIPLFALKEKAQKLDKCKTMVIYCTNSMCTASSAAFKIFKDLGFEHVYAYEAGMADWYKRGFPIEGECSLAYLKSEV